MKFEIFKRFLQKCYCPKLFFATNKQRLLQPLKIINDDHHCHHYEKNTISRPPLLYHIRASDLVADLAVIKAVIITQMTNDHGSHGNGNDNHEHCDLPSCPLNLGLLNRTNTPGEQQLRR